MRIQLTLCLRKQKVHDASSDKYMTEANSLRKTAKQKNEELKTVEQQLDEMLLKLRNS